MQDIVSCIAEDAVIDICVFYYRVGIMPLAVDDQRDSKGG